MLLLCIFAPLWLNAQIVRTFSLEYHEKEFDITEMEGLVHLGTNNYIAILKNDTSAPALPFICLNVLIGPDESYVDFTSTNTETLLREGITIAPNPIEVFTDENVTTPTPSFPLVYEKSVYPDLQIEYTGTHMVNGYKFLTFLVCPFRYDFTKSKLYLNSRINLNIQLKSSKNNNLPADNLIVSVRKQKDNDSFFINEEHKSILYANTFNQAPSKNNTASDYPYRYLIITTNALKNEFERLARWKSIKGVKAKVLTVEEICIADNRDISTQLKIKYAIKDYYEPYERGIKYVLLGGDDNLVPTQLCYIKAEISTGLEWNMTPTDLFYGSFTDMDWDKNKNGKAGEVEDTVCISPDIAITRLSVSNVNNTKTMIDRILSYENIPNTSIIVDSILLCGVKTNQMYVVDGRNVSDMEGQSNKLFSDYISPNWVGSPFHFYDTFTDHDDNEDYDVTSGNLQFELSKRYSFVNVASHGLQWLWNMESIYDEYLTDSANTLVNPHYTVITTGACQTNAFDFANPCLSEAFMRNTDGKVLSYYGSSREAIGNGSRIFLGSNMEYIGRFYNKLFSSSGHRIGEAIVESKKTFVANCYNYNSTRWMFFTLNGLGDPEMPIYTNQTTAIPNVTVNYNGTSLTVNSGVVRPYLCLKSKFDDGNSFYYYNYGNGEPWEGGNTYTGMSGEYTYCLTKDGYLPTVATIGETVHLQNESFWGKCNVIAFHVLIGSNVTNQISVGAVTVENGSTVINSHNDVIITGDFEVKLGAELKINMTNQNVVNL